MDRVNGKKIDGNSRIGSDVDSRAVLIQMLIPIALELDDSALGMVLNGLSLIGNRTVFKEGQRL